MTDTHCGTPAKPANERSASPALTAMMAPLHRATSPQCSLRLPHWLLSPAPSDPAVEIGPLSHILKSHILLSSISAFRHSSEGRKTINNKALPCVEYKHIKRNFYLLSQNLILNPRRIDVM